MRCGGAVFFEEVYLCLCSASIDWSFFFEDELWLFVVPEYIDIFRYENVNV